MLVRSIVAGADPMRDRGPSMARVGPPPRRVLREPPGQPSIRGMRCLTFFCTPALLGDRPSVGAIRRRIFYVARRPTFIFESSGAPPLHCMFGIPRGAHRECIVGDLGRHWGDRAEADTATDTQIPLPLSPSSLSIAAYVTPPPLPDPPPSSSPFLSPARGGQFGLHLLTVR